MEKNQSIRNQTQTNPDDPRAHRRCLWIYETGDEPRRCDHQQQRCNRELGFCNTKHTYNEGLTKMGRPGRHWAFPQINRTLDSCKPTRNTGWDCTIWWRDRRRFRAVETHLDCICSRDWSNEMPWKNSSKARWKQVAPPVVIKQSGIFLLRFNSEDEVNRILAPPLNFVFDKRYYWKSMKLEWN